MTELNKDLTIAQIVSLMIGYSFDTNQQSVEKLVQQWQQNYPVHWIYLATIEALYLGRYKAISIEQIMIGWDRRGQPNTHFNGDFERVICRKLPRHLSTVDYEKRSYNGSRDARSPKRFEGNNELDSQSNNNGKHDPSVAPLNSNLADHKVGCDENMQNPIIATEVTPLPKRQISSPPQSVLSTEKTKNSQSHSKRIVTFQPAPDASSFFQKLKALADNQRKGDEEVTGNG